MQNPAIIPSISYRKPGAAVEFLCKAFGFERQTVDEENGHVVTAQLRLGAYMVLLGPVQDLRYRHTWLRRFRPGQRSLQMLLGEDEDPQPIYITVDDVDQHWRTALKAGATILSYPHSEGRGGRSYSCADPEGHIWTFGSFDPHASIH